VLRKAFASVTTTEVLHTEKGQPIASWRLSVCRVYQGRFPLPRKPSGNF
jgi:hypothetical protein